MLIEFVDLVDRSKDVIKMEETIEKKSKILAKYVLVVMVRGLANDLEFKQLKTYSSYLESENMKLNRKITQNINYEGVILSESESSDILEIIETSNESIKNSYPDEKC